MNKEPQSTVFLKIFILFFFLITLAFNLTIKGEQQFILLAKSFFHGKTYFIEKPEGLGDTFFYNGNYYWPNPPFPVITLIPFVYIFNLFNGDFYQGYLQFFLVVGVYHLVYKISFKQKYLKSDSAYLAFAFCFATAFIGVAVWPWSWYFSHVLTVFLIFLSIFEFQTKKRFFLIGILFALILATRFSAATGIIFYILFILITKNSLKFKIKKLTLLLSPLVISFSLLILYNFVRYDSPKELGYLKNTLPSFHEKAREYGVFDLKHIPGNLFYLFLSTPIPVYEDNISQVLKFPYLKSNQWGMSIFITSPIFFYLFFLAYKDKISKIILVTIATIGLHIFLYYGVGWRQFGYRYSLDFLPLLYFLLIRNYRKKYKILSPGIKTVILISAFTNLYLFLSGFSN